MKKIFFLSILFLLLFHYVSVSAEMFNKNNCSSAITWEPNGGRFGDNLLSYSRAKWLSYCFDIPLLYLPFKYSDQLMINTQEDIFTPEVALLFSTATHLPYGSKYRLLPDNNTLYISHWKTDIFIDWYDNIFVQELRKTIAPCYEIKKITIPDNYLSIAVHVRTGGSFAPDTAQEKERCPLRFAPDEFFIAQIKRIADMFKHEKLYVYIFTDHANPIELKNKFKKILNDPRITFDYRHENNSHNTNVLEDFFSMMDFDCLIRPGSHFSRFVQRLGNNKLVIYPESIKKLNTGKTIIDVINIKTRTSVNDRWKTKKITIA